MSEGNGWRPNPGDQITGKVIDIATGDGGYGPYPIVTLSTETGEEVPVHAFHSVLRNELARRRPKVGDELGITYLGKATGRDGKSEYHTYRVTGGQVQGYDWSQDLPVGEQPVEPVEPIAPVQPPAQPAAAQPAAAQPEPVAAAVTPAAEDDIPF